MNMKRLLTLSSGIIIIFAFLLSWLPEYVIYADMLYILSILLGGYFVFLAALRGLFKKRILNIDFLVILAATGALYINQLAEAAAVIFFFSLAEVFEEFGIERSRRAVKELVEKSPKKAKLKSGVVVDVEKVNVKDRIVVYPGDMISLDGVIVDGYSSIDQAAITGESIPKEKCVGGSVFAGTLNLSGYLEIEVTKNSRDSTFSKIIELVEKAQKSRPQIQNFIDTFSKYYTPVVVISAIFIVLVPTLFLGGVFEVWLNRGLVLLVISCPCALVVSTPVSIASAVGRASRSGILIKGGKYLELLAKTKMIAFDKTKTLTLGEPRITDVVPFEGFSVEEVLADAAGIEVFSSHPLSKSIVEFAKKRGVSLHKMQHYQYTPGKGGKACCFVCKGVNKIGNLKLISPVAKITKELKEAVQHLENEGKTVVLISEKDRVIGALGICDKPRPEAFESIKKLHSMGIKTTMLTGDALGVANFIGKQLGIKKIYASLLPDKKEEIIKDLKKKYGVALMVGDGINDAPSLATASVGIAMGGKGSDIAIETADVALMNSNLLNIPFAVRLGRKTLNTVYVNIAASLGIKLLFFILAPLGAASLEAAIVADAGVAILVILNSLRLFGLRNKPT